MVYSLYKLQRFLYHCLHDQRVPTISQLLHMKYLKASHTKVSKEVQQDRLQGQDQDVLQADIKLVVNEHMRNKDATTATQLHALLVSCVYSTSLRTILRCRTFTWTDLSEYVTKQNLCWSVTLSD